MGSGSWDPVAYDRVAAPQLAWGKDLLRQRNWRGDEVVLDAGCGTGALAEALLRLVPRGRVIAVDAEPRMVEAARTRLASAGARARVMQSDLVHADPGEPVDVVFSNAALHWVPDHDAAFAHFLRILKPGGEVLIQCGGEGNLRAARSLAQQVLERAEFAGAFRGWTAPWHYEDDASTTERLLITGFVHPSARLDPAPVTFPDAAAFEAFARTVLLRPYVDALKAPGAAERFVKEFLAHWNAAGRPWTLDYVRLTVRAQRPPHHS